ncbi:MAG TPA: hypothetical protein VLT83_14090 [Opitutaceae bacterium]|nr:hypothetical protein [Opitutaceae bacterium]
MSESAVGVRPVPRFLTVSLARDLGILLCLSVMFPFMVHLIPVPGDAQLGPRLLPMFYAPLLAALWGRVRSAVTLALLAPWLNWALTAHPSPAGAIVMVVQLSVFVGTLRILLNAVGARWYLAAPAFLAGMAASAALTATVPALVGGQAALAWALQGVVVGIPGIAILVLINWAALRFYPPGPGGGSAAA